MAVVGVVLAVVLEEDLVEVVALVVVVELVEEEA